MTTRIRVFFSAILVTPILITGVAGAVEGTNQTTAPTNEEKASMQQRLEKRKAELKVKLSVPEETKLKAKCKASQGKLSSLDGRIKGLETSRGAVYKALTEHLTKLSTKLKAQGVDTKALDEEITILGTKIDTFKTDLAAYKLAVSDLADMECVSDPTAFKASLEAARAARQKAAADAADVKAYVKDTIKPTLQQLRTQLEAAKKEGSN